MLKRAPADMIFAALLVFFAGVLLVFGLSECGRSNYWGLERLLAEAPK